MRALVISVVVRFGALPITFLLGAILARMLGPEDLGNFTFVVTISTIISVPLYAGWSQFLTREVSYALSETSWGRIKGLRLFTLLIICLYGLILLVASQLIIKHGLTTSMTIAILLLSFIYPMAANSGAILRSLGWRVVGQLPEQLARPLFMMAIIILYFILYEDKPNYQLAIKFQILAYIFTAILSFILLYKALSSSSAYSQNSAEFYPRKWVLSSLPFIATATLNGINNYTSILLTGFLSSTEEVGYYRVAEQMASLVNIGLAGALAWAAPALAHAHSNSSNQELYAVIKKVRYVSLATGLPIAVFLAIFSKEIIILIFGAEYNPGFLALRILLVSEILICSFFIYQYCFMMSTTIKHAIIGVLVAIVVNICFAVFLTPKYGAVGAAISGTIAIAVWMMIVTRKAHLLYRL